MAIHEVALVVPVFNEQDRWDEAYWQAVASIPRVSVVFVDDGSTDGSGHLLDRAVGLFGAHVIRLDRNVGKAEAVRQGMCHALNGEVKTVGFLDADAAFPVSEIRRLVSLDSDHASDSAAERSSIWSARVKLAGRDIQRKPLRHYGSRILLTALALRLDYEIYDTQSGFKLFPASDQLRGCLSEPFRTRWFVDLEIFLRWRQATGSSMRVWEEPVKGWRDVDGSSLRRGQVASIAGDLLTLLRYASPADDPRPRAVAHRRGTMTGEEFSSPGG